MVEVAIPSNTYYNCSEVETEVYPQLEPGDLNKSPPNFRLPLALINLLKLSLHFRKLGSNMLIKNVTVKLGFRVIFFLSEKKKSTFNFSIICPRGCLCINLVHISQRVCHV